MLLESDNMFMTSLPSSVVEFLVLFVRAKMLVMILLGLPLMSRFLLAGIF